MILNVCEQQIFNLDGYNLVVPCIVHIAHMSIPYTDAHNLKPSLLKLSIIINDIVTLYNYVKVTLSIKRWLNVQK